MIFTSAALKVAATAAIIAAAPSASSSCGAAKNDSKAPRPAHSSAKHADQGAGVQVVPSHCTIVRHRNGDEDWICEDVDPRHPHRYPHPKLRSGDRVTGHADAG